MDKDHYFLELSYNVILNPLRAKDRVNRLEDWPWRSYLAMIGNSLRPEWLTTDWILSLFGKQRSIAIGRYRQFVLEGVQHQPEIWSHLIGQIYLGDEAFVMEMQKRIRKEKDDLNIPKQQKRPIAKTLPEIAVQYKDRNTAIIAAYKTGAYSQREIGDFYRYTQRRLGLLFVKTRTLDSGPDALCVDRKICDGVMPFLNGIAL